MTLHNRLIDNCRTVFDLDKMAWFHDLRMLLNECVAVVDITLHQLYFKAQYGPKPAGWRFDPDKLGIRHGVRLRDKFNWIGIITGRPLDNVRDEVQDLMVLKAIRNHWNHFDPPCVAFTIDDVVEWLNRVPSVGKLLWRIRKKIGASLSKDIVEIIALPLVEFVPKDLTAQRLPQGNDVGYRSSTWREP